MTVFIEGFTGDCAFLNGEYELPILEVGSPPAPICAWTSTINPGAYEIRVDFIMISGVLHIRLHIGSVATLLACGVKAWSGSCCDLLSEDISFGGDVAGCDEYVTAPYCDLSGSPIGYVTANCCCADASPAELEVTISGVNSGTTNITLDAGTCTIECDQLNDDYVFTQSAPCQWSTTRDWDVTCGGTPMVETFTLFLYFQTISGTQYLYFLIRTGTNYVQYLARTPVPDDCCDLATYIIELSSYLSSSFCTANLVAASELEITASTCV